MRFVFALTWNSLRRFRPLLIISGLVLAGFQFLLVEVGAYLDRTGSFSGFVNMFPPFVKEMMGGSFFTFLSFAGMVSLGYFHIAVLGTLTGLVIAFGTEPAAEIEGGFADLLLAKAVSRHVPITRTVLVLSFSIVTLLSLMMTATAIGLKLLAPPGAVYPFQSLFFLVANLAALLLCWGGIALAAGAFVRRRGSATLFAGMLALIAFLLDYLGRLWKPVSTISRISPFHEFSPLEIVLNHAFPARDIEILLAVAAVAILTAYVVYARRDL
jgi:hypothetical protein